MGLVSLAPHTPNTLRRRETASADPVRCIQVISPTLRFETVRNHGSAWPQWGEKRARAEAARRPPQLVGQRTAPAPAP